MNSLIRNTVSFFEKIAGVDHLTATDSIVSGYSYPISTIQRELSSDSCNHRQVGILYADIADYSRLTEQDEEGTHHRLVENMKIMEAYVSANNGRVAHFTDDAILAEFKDADNALNCAIDMQLSDHQLSFRIGVKYSDENTDHNLCFGSATNFITRLENITDTGGICISESVRHRLKKKPSFNFVSTNRQGLKGS